MALKSLTEEILLKNMKTRSLIAKIRSSNALFTKILIAESLMIKSPATKNSPTEMTTMFKRPMAKKK